MQVAKTLLHKSRWAMCHFNDLQLSHTHMHAHLSTDINK